MRIPVATIFTPMFLVSAVMLPMSVVKSCSSVHTIDIPKPTSDNASHRNISSHGVSGIEPQMGMCAGLVWSFAACHR